LAEIELEIQKTSFFGTINPEKMVNQITAQKIHQKTVRIPSIPLVRCFTFCIVNHRLTAGFLTSQSVRILPIPSDFTPPPEKKSKTSTKSHPAATPPPPCIVEILRAIDRSPRASCEQLVA
jgi:hypothetical protein